MRQKVPQTEAISAWKQLLKLLVFGGSLAVCAQEDPYEHYVKNSEDFKPVKQEPGWCWQAFPSWTYMPWTYQWNIGYTEASGQWSLDHGYNGAFIDRGNVHNGANPTGRLDWINQFQLRFYMDHTAGKGDLHLWDGNQAKPHLEALHGNGLRTVPVNTALQYKLQEIIRRNISQVKSSPFRAAYALDDEISWGHFVHPTMWRVTDDPGAYAKWRQEIYGPGAPQRAAWITYEDLRPKLKTWSIGEFDASPLLDQWTFNDSYWNNFLGRLVEYANSLDPSTPCGFVGGQCPNAFGGYDYAKLMRKIQFIEAYNIGSSQAVIRSLNPHNALPTVTTHFHQSVDDDIWQTWYYLAHGNRGFIGWVEGWFDGEKPKPWHAQVAPTYQEASRQIGPLMTGAEWIHDDIAIYYNHSSIQLGWILDAEAHGRTWINRNGDERLGASHQVRKAWENMLRDSGLQYNFLSYVDVIQKGVPPEYRVLILPACLCLSEVEARRIAEFCRKGGTVIADYWPGLWDQHGRGRPGGGALDAMFGVRHDPAWRQADVFGGKLWCEVDQDANFSWKTHAEFLTRHNTCLQDQSGFNKAVRRMKVNTVTPYGQGTAVLLNLSPQWYNAYREAGQAAAAKREVFLRHVTDAGIQPWVTVESNDGRVFGHEITYWSLRATNDAIPARTLVFLCFNPEIEASQLGGGNAVGLKTNRVQVTLRLAGEITEARNERTGESLGRGKSFAFDWKQNEAIVMSFANPRPRVASNTGVTLTLSSPRDYEVVQRTSKAGGALIIRGEFTDLQTKTTILQARLITAGSAGSWRPLEVNLDAATFAARFEAPSGGWHRLEARAIHGATTLAESAVEHVGVGEVFVVAGQSNSANHGAEKQNSQTGLVAAFDGENWRLAQDPQPGASGNGGSFMPPFGDAIARKFQVPVGIVACGVGATSVREWLPKGATFSHPPTLTGQVTQLSNGEWESNGTLFRTFTTRMKALRLRGFRAVLWHQGESDANQKDPTRTLPGKLYRQYLERIICDSRREIGWDAPWFVAQVSYHVPGDEASPDIRAAQASLWSDGLAFEGPDTDALKSDFRDDGGRGVHFSGPGLREHAARWVDKIAPWLEQQLSLSP